VGDGSIEIVIIARDGTGNKKATLPTTKDAQVAPLGGGKLAYTKVESSSTGDRRTLWIRGADGKDARVTSTSVDTDILKPLADGGVLFLSRAEYTVDDKSMLRAISGDGSKVKDLLTLKGTDLLEIPIVSGDGKLFSYAVFPTDSFEANPKGVIWVATAKEKAKWREAEGVAGEKIAGLGETIVDALQKAIDDGSPVKEDGIRVDVPGKRAVIPMATKGEVTDESLMREARSLRGAVMPVLAKEGYSAVLPLEGHEDAVAVMRWHPEFGRHLTYMVAYNHWVPVRDEYDIVIEDLVYMKLPGCRDPRLVQLHCNGWIAAVKDLGTDSLDLVCRADPLDPGMKLREGRETVTGVAPGSEAISIDVIADKVDPRRSHRSTFELQIFKGSQQLPFYDASWAEATTAWIEVLRGIPGGEVVPTKKLHYFALGDEEFVPLAKWFPSTVVKQEQHLDNHIFIDEEGTPAMEDKEGWDALATALMESFTPFLEEHDPDNLAKVRVNLYKGQLLMTEMWHKTPEELAIEGCDLGDGDACYQLGLIMMEKGQKMAADYAFYDGCDMGSELACEVISGAGASTGGGGGAKPAPEPEAEEPALKKKSALPPGATKEPGKAPSLKKSEIQAAIRENLSEVKYCFQKEASGEGQMAVTVKIFIDPKGKVEGVSVKHSNVSQSIETCVLQAVRRIEFPVPPDGQPIKLSYPFTYVP
jgi:TonB family protein